MKKILSFVMALALMCGMLVSCENAESILAKADEALAEAPYKVNMKLNFECDNEELNQIFSLMNMDIPVTVDGENVAMDMSIDIMGVSASSKMVVADKVLYYDMEAMGQIMKMKASMTDEQYEEFLEENNTEMMIKPEDFGELTVESKDGKKYIACGKITDEALKELNDMMGESLSTLEAKASVSELIYGVTINDGKYEKMDMTCVYSVTIAEETCNVTFNLSAEYSYDNVEKITAPADADEYQEIGYSDIMG